MSNETSFEAFAKKVQSELEQIRSVLVLLVSWTAQVAGSPISIDEARTLLQRLESHPTPCDESSPLSVRGEQQP